MSILLDGGSGSKDFLAELYGKVIENVNKQMVSSRIKNMDLSGNPEAGSVEAKRFANAVSKAYGTARAAAKGDNITAKPVVIPINVDKEIVEELEEKDVALYGVDGVLTRRANNHVQAMATELDKAFFAVVPTDGTALTLTATDIQEQIEEAIQTCETTSNSYVDGVPRSMINVVCSTAIYGQMRNYLDTTAVSNVDTAAEEFNTFHGVKVFPSIHLPASVDFAVLVDGAIAQPVRSKQYTAEKVPLSDAVAVELFYNYGTKSVMPDLIYYKAH